MGFVNTGKISPIHTIILESSSVAQSVAMTSRQVNVASSIPGAAMCAKQGKDVQDGWWGKVNVNLALPPPQNLHVGLRFTNSSNIPGRDGVRC